ncbi:hypothetical protein NUU61_000055 [Penicillium alfredii]|uniref:Uncharacterized protein n=1 Tax=Penicillium alfredii TaxID=1506179 RepID=A0A9W9G8Y8_9EURO|nr:uncharacterized protein NUU61_000055 [Penicillium alfredii]KAJ5114296.1 hypothetical protein NUU61_000055 [Penicillium alfredii]
MEYLTQAAVTAVPYTASPVRLLWSDIRLILQNIWTLPGIFLPLRLGRTSPLDELFVSLPNGATVALHGFLVVYQLAFLVSLPIVLLLMMPALWILTYVAGFFSVNYLICILLNGRRRIITSQVPVTETPGHERECWFFINGVAVGRRWLQQNINQLSYTFGRKVTGVHNRTSGIIFDLLECLIQRDLSYATDDVRSTYELLKKALLNPNCDKVVLLLHSQGAIEGGLIIDWLLDELPRDLLRSLEVYTFAAAANHFNNPWTSCPKPSESPTTDPSGAMSNTIRHIEHYANDGDFVARWGLLHFIDVPNRYMGQVFIRSDSGHMMNQHYLDNMFTLGPDQKVLDSNPFMETTIATQPNKTMREQDGAQGKRADGKPSTSGVLGRQSPEPNGSSQTLRIKNVSRLWQYRNGGSPGTREGA